MNLAAAILLAVTLGSVALPLRAAESPDTSIEDPERSAKEFAASIERFNARDPQSPDTLNARLSYAVFLAKMRAGDCQSAFGQRAESTGPRQSQSRTRRRAALGTSALERRGVSEFTWREPRAAALNLVTRNCAMRSCAPHSNRRNARSPCIATLSMPYPWSPCNSIAAVVYHDLGDTAAAVSALQAAIAMDREYGYADDAEDNYSQLLEWTGQKADDDQVAARMQDFPERSATLAFDWFPSDAGVKIRIRLHPSRGQRHLHCPQHPRRATPRP